MEAKQVSMKATEAPSASDIVYLFGDRFVGKARVGGETLAYGAAKVKHKDLARELLLSAFAQLASEGYLRMESEKRRSATGELKEVGQRALSVFFSAGLEAGLPWYGIRVFRSDGPKQPLHGLEAAVWESISDDPEGDPVSDIIRSIIWEPSSDPWRIVIDKAKEGLQEQGYLVAEKEDRKLRSDKVHWSAKEELIAAHEGRVEVVRAMLDSFKAADPELYKKLAESVKAGILSMKEVERTIDWTP